MRGDHNCRNVDLNLKIMVNLSRSQNEFHQRQRARQQIRVLAVIPQPYDDPYRGEFVFAES